MNHFFYSYILSGFLDVENSSTCGWDVGSDFNEKRLRALTVCVCV